MARVVMCAVLVVLSLALLAEAGEKKVTIDQVPAKVRAAILKAVGEGRLVDIGELTDGDKKTYEIEMVVDGKEYDVLFAEDGTVLRKVFEGRAAPKKEERAGKADGFQDFFDLESRKFSTTGRNRFFILEPGYQLVLQGVEGEKTVKLVITVLSETRKTGNVETRVVEERESENGKLIEISRNFFAICTETKSVFYFGGEVDDYKDGKVVGHAGAWVHGKDGARAGLMMPGEPALGARYYQEIAPKVALARAEIVSVDATLTTPAGKFTSCVKCMEENPLDKEKEPNMCAPGVGLVLDDVLVLVKYGFLKK